MAEALFCALLLSSSAAAQNAPLRAAILSHGDQDAMLLERIRGHVVDLGVSLVEVETSDARAPRDLAARLDANRDVSHDLHVPVVIWFEHSLAGAVTVFVHDVASDRVFVRSAQQEARETPAESGPTTGTREAIAMIVRSALDALSQGVSVGEPTQEVIEEAVRRRDRPSPWGGFVDVGWRLSFDPQISNQARARLAARYAFLIAGVAGGFGLRDSEADDIAEQRFHQHTLSGFAGVSLRAAPRLRVLSTLHAGVHWLRRKTAARDPEFIPEPPDSHRSLVLSYELSLLVRWHRFVSTGLGAGIDYSPRRPVIGYLTEGEFVPLVRFAHVRPWVMASVGVEFP